MGYSCVCGWRPQDDESGYHLTTADYKAIFKHEKECDKYIEWWEAKREENVKQFEDKDLDDDDVIKKNFHRYGVRK